MPTFEANVRVTYNETWSVEADSAEEARAMFENLHRSVDANDAGRELVDWDVGGVKESK